MLPGRHLPGKHLQKHQICSVLGPEGSPRKRRNSAQQCIAERQLGTPGWAVATPLTAPLRHMARICTLMTVLPIPMAAAAHMASTCNARLPAQGASTEISLAASSPGHLLSRTPGTLVKMHAPHSAYPRAPQTYPRTCRMHSIAPAVKNRLGCASSNEFLFSHTKIAAISYNKPARPRT